jgi:2-polyprenyl-6-hydroxyphenyl methylase/3-demethylubiquinone-9 3-methyltransferase
MAKLTNLQTYFDNIDFDLLPDDVINIIENLLTICRQAPPTLEDIWYLIDYVWDEIGCDNTRPILSKINAFYNHPVWLLNGLFIEAHEVSIQHRSFVADWIKYHSPEIKCILDFGGGFGTIARMISKNCPNLAVDILEPSPTSYAIGKSNIFSNINFLSALNTNKMHLYDCVIAFDVMEHMIDPIATLKKLIDHTTHGGYLIFANNFHPVIKCHLPSTFHLRYTFPLFAYILGLKNIERYPNSHIHIYRKLDSIRLNNVIIRKLETVSKVFYPFFKIISKIRKSLIRINDF